MSSIYINFLIIFIKIIIFVKTHKCFLDFKAKKYHPFGWIEFLIVKNMHVTVQIAKLIDLRFRTTNANSIEHTPFNRFAT